jgi:hypothetical protein
MVLGAGLLSPHTAPVSTRRMSPSRAIAFMGLPRSLSAPSRRRVWAGLRPSGCSWAKRRASGRLRLVLLLRLFLRPLLQQTHTALRQQHGLTALHKRIAFDDELVLLIGG